MKSRKPRILFLPKYAEKAASCRYRILQYLPFLDEADIEYEVYPLFDNEYLDMRFFSNEVSIKKVAISFVKRVIILLKRRKFDIVFVHYETFPYMPSFIDTLFTGLYGIVVIDLDDAIFNNYKYSKKVTIRAIAGRKFNKLFSNADLILAGNSYLANYARKYSQSVEVMPTVIDLDKYLKNNRTIDKRHGFKVGWIGSPSTAEYLHLVHSPLSQLCEIDRNSISASFVGAGSIDFPGVSHEVINWSEDTEVELLNGFDVGIMPLPDTPWARGKCGFKLIQYMACSLPVVASPVGVNKEIVIDGVNGFLAETAEDWFQALNTLRENPDLRIAMGKAGRKIVEEKYCLQITGPRFVQVLQDVFIGDSK